MYSAQWTPLLAGLVGYSKARVKGSNPHLVVTVQVSCVGQVPGLCVAVRVVAHILHAMLQQ